jgi:Cys-tRNA(Pro)/Cys-tRNA(Cys) deacylase
MKKLYPTFIDETCLLWDKITVSAGMKGCQLLLSPEKLIPLVNAVTADLTV